MTPSSLALISGDIDWAGHTIPRIEKTYVNRDPKHFQYWFPPLGGMVFLYANTTTAPLGKVSVRRALSHAIDRERIVRIGMSGYTKRCRRKWAQPYLPTLEVLRMKVHRPVFDSTVQEQQNFSAMPAVHKTKRTMVLR